MLELVYNGRVELSRQSVDSLMLLTKVTVVAFSVKIFGDSPVLRIRKFFILIKQIIRRTSQVFFPWDEGEGAWAWGQTLSRGKVGGGGGHSGTRSFHLGSPRSTLQIFPVPSRAFRYTGHHCREINVNKYIINDFHTEKCLPDEDDPDGIEKT